MFAYTEEVTFVLSIATALGGVAVISLIIFFLLRPRPNLWLSRFIARWGLWLALLITLTATLGSLFYSDIAGFIPCKLCWYQRILMYPLPILLGTAIWHKDYRISRYINPLTIIGALIAAYHYLLQLDITPLTSDCAIIGYGSSCSDRFFLELGYITIPMMALTAFVLINLLANGYKKFHSN